MEQQYPESKPGMVISDTIKKRAQLMIEAIMNNDLKSVITYIEKGYPVKIINDQSISLIGAAAFVGNVEIVRALLEAYPDNQEQKIEANCFSFHTTPYHFQLSGKLPQNIQLNHTDYGYAPLHWACSNPETKHRESDILKIVQRLLYHGANPSYSASDVTGFFKGSVPIEPEKALDLAYAQELNRVAALLKQAEKAKFKQKNNERREALFLSYFNDDENDHDGEKEQPTIETDINLAEELFIAAKIGDHLKVNYLLTQNAPTNYVNKFDYLTALFAAANNGNYKVVKNLIKHVDPNYQYIPKGSTIGGPTALHALCRNNNIYSLTRVKIASLLLAHGARTDLNAFDPRIINRQDKRDPFYKHPADLIENSLALYQLLRPESTNVDSSRCLIN